MNLDRRTFFKRMGLGAAGLALLPALRVAGQNAGAGLPRSSPETQGVSSAGILDFLEGIKNSKHEFHSFMLARHGYVVAEGWWTPYRAPANHMLYSLSKSFTSTAVGLAVTDGLLTVEDPVVSFFPDKLPAKVEDNLAALRVKHLLTMSVGHAKDSTPIITKEQDWVKAFLALPIANPPGSVFLYNSGATYMLSAIVQKKTGKKVIDYLRPRLFEPLAVEGMTWETCPMGINTGGWGLAIQTETIAKFGQLYLRKGDWNGRQLIPEKWVDEATTFKIQQPPPPGKDLKEMIETSDWHQGYCYQFWRCRHHGFRGDGAFGQYCIVLPDLDAVIAITSETADMGGEMNLIWNHLLPAINQSALAPDPTSHTQLQTALAALALPTAGGALTSPMAHMVSAQNFALEPNDLGLQSVKLNYHNNTWTLTFKEAAAEHTIDCGVGRWVDGVTSLPGTPPKLTVGDLRPVKLAASAAWSDVSTLKLLWRYYETPHHDTVTCQFNRGKLTLSWLNSLTEKSATHPETRPTLTGQMT